VRRKLLAAAVTVAALGGGAGVALAGAGNPNNTGPPSQTCQNQPTSPGNASGSPGSPFNETTPGTGGNAYNNAGAPSQYDVACYQVSHH
jgi:hypothetical protein